MATHKRKHLPDTPNTVFQTISRQSEASQITMLVHSYTTFPLVFFFFVFQLMVDVTFQFFFFLWLLLLICHFSLSSVILLFWGVVPVMIYNTFSTTFSLSSAILSLVVAFNHSLFLSVLCKWYFFILMFLLSTFIRDNFSISDSCN